MIKSKCKQSADLLGHIDIVYNDAADNLNANLLFDGWVSFERHVLEQEETWTDDVFLTIYQSHLGKSEQWGSFNFQNVIANIADGELLAFYTIRRPTFIFIPAITEDLVITHERKVHKEFKAGDELNYEYVVSSPFDTSLSGGGR